MNKQMQLIRSASSCPIVKVPLGFLYIAFLHCFRYSSSITSLENRGFVLFAVAMNLAHCHLHQSA